MTGRLALNSFVALVAAFLVLPILAIVPVAFSAQSFIRLPPESWSLRWWGTFFNDASWRLSLLASLKVATLTTLTSVVAGTAAAFGIARSGPRGRALLTGLFLGPVMTPTIVLAVALYSMARATGLVGTTTALVIAHTMLALPFVVLNVGVSLDGLDRRLLLAAAGLGAGTFRIFRTVTLPLIAPGVVGGAVFAFVTLSVRRSSIRPKCVDRVCSPTRAKASMSGSVLSSAAPAPGRRPRTIAIPCL